MHFAAPVSVRMLPLATLAAAGFLSSAGARAIDPLIAAIADDFQTTVSGVSIVVAAFSISYGCLQLLLGPLSDSIGKMRVMTLALIGYAAFTGFSALATSVPWLALLRACSGAASAGLIPVCLAYIGDAVPYERRQITLSRFLTGVMLAQTIAGPMSGICGEYVGWRGVFLILSGSALVLAAVLRAQMFRLPPERCVPVVYSTANYTALLRTPAARFLLIVTFVEGALVTATVPFVAPFLNEVFSLSYAESGSVIGCFGLGALAYGRVAKIAVLHLGESGMVLVGATLMGAAALAAAVSHTWWVLGASEFSLGFGYFTMHTVLQARATELLPAARSTAVSTFVFLLFSGQSIGALASGAIIASGGYRVAFGVSGVLFILLGAVVSAGIRHHSA